MALSSLVVMKNGISPTLFTNKLNVLLTSLPLKSVITKVTLLLPTWPFNGVPESILPFNFNHFGNSVADSTTLSLISFCDIS